MTPEIRQLPIGGNLREFLDVVDSIYRGDPNYVRSLDFDLKDRLSPKNPFFEHATGTIFTAYRAGRCVGRCTAQIDREHLKRHRDDAGFFGFLDTVEDSEVSRALLNAAANWLRDRGMKRMRGPFSLSIYEEVGCLVEGFDTPPMLLMPHHRPYQGALIEQAGLTKLKDLYAWRYEIGDVPDRARKAHDQIAALPEIRARQIDKQRIDVEARTLLNIFNDAWADNWGHVDSTDKEAAKLAADLRMFLNPELSCVVEIDGEPAAFALALPNLNELIRDFDGKLFPFGLPKLLWRLKVEGAKTARMIMLGVRKKIRLQKKYAALSAYLYVRMNDAGRRAGVQWGELSWTLEDNGPINVAIKLMGGKIYKRYRVYEREL